MRIKLLNRLFEQGIIKVELDLIDGINTAISNSNYKNIYCNRGAQTISDTKNKESNTNEINLSNQYTQIGEPKQDQESSTEIINTTAKPVQTGEPKQDQYSSTEVINTAAKPVQTEISEKQNQETQIPTETTSQYSITDKIHFVSKKNQTTIKKDKETATKIIKCCDRASETTPVITTSNHTQTDDHILFSQNFIPMDTQTKISVPPTWEERSTTETKTCHEMTLPVSTPALSTTSVIATELTFTSSCQKSISASNVESDNSDQNLFALLCELIETKKQIISLLKTNHHTIKSNDLDEYNEYIVELSADAEIVDVLNRIKNLSHHHSSWNSQSTYQILKKGMISINSSITRMLDEILALIDEDIISQYICIQNGITIDLKTVDIHHELSILFIHQQHNKNKLKHESMKELHKAKDKANTDYIELIDFLIDTIINYAKKINTEKIEQFNLCSSTIEDNLKKIITIYFYGNYQIKHTYPLLIIRTMELLLLMTGKRYPEVIFPHIMHYLTDPLYMNLICESENSLMTNDILQDTLGMIEAPLPYISFFSILFKLYCKNNAFVKAAIMLTNHLNYISDPNKAAYPDKKSKDDLKSESTGAIITKIYTALTEPEVNKTKEKDLKERRVICTKAQHQFNLFQAIQKCKDYIDSKAFESIEKDNTCKERLDYWKKNSREELLTTGIKEPCKPPASDQYLQTSEDTVCAATDALSVLAQPSPPITSHLDLSVLTTQLLTLITDKTIEICDVRHDSTHLISTYDLNEIFYLYNKIELEDHFYFQRKEIIPYCNALREALVSMIETLHEHTPTICKTLIKTNKSDDFKIRQSCFVNTVKAAGIIRQLSIIHAQENSNKYQDIHKYNNLALNYDLKYIFNIHRALTWLNLIMIDCKGSTIKDGTCLSILENNLQNIINIFFYVNYNQYAFLHPFPAKMLTYLEALSEKRYPEILSPHLTLYLTNKEYRNAVDVSFAPDIYSPPCYHELLETVFPITDPLPYFTDFHNLAIKYHECGDALKATIVLTRHLESINDCSQQGYSYENASANQRLQRIEDLEPIIPEIYRKLLDKIASAPPGNAPEEPGQDEMQTLNKNLFQAIIHCKGISEYTKFDVTNANYQFELQDALKAISEPEGAASGPQISAESKEVSEKTLSTSVKHNRDASPNGKTEQAPDVQSSSKPKRRRNRNRKR